jgi:hypothetical protein
MMNPNIPDEWKDAIIDYIYTGLMIETLYKKIEKADGNYKKMLENRLSIVAKKRKELNDFLKQNKIKVYPMKRLDDLFVAYPYSVKCETGYKEGQQEFWIHAMRFKLKKLLKQLIENQ